MNRSTCWRRAFNSSCESGCEATGDRLDWGDSRNRLWWLEASDSEDNCPGDPWEDPRESVRSPRCSRCTSLSEGGEDFEGWGDSIQHLSLKSPARLSPQGVTL